jgi:hypothetical protein
VCHTSPKLPWYSTTEAYIYINGSIRAKCVLEFPDTASFSINRLGATGIKTEDHVQGSMYEDVTTSNPIIDVDEDYLLNSHAPSSASICALSITGQMTSAYILDEILSVQQLNAIYELGPGHSSQFRAEDAISYPEAGLVLFDGSLHSRYFVDINLNLSQLIFLFRIVLQIHPTAVQSSGYYNYVNDVGPRRQGSAELRDVFACSTKCLRTAIHALGGVEVIIPLVTHMDYPIGPGPASSDGWPENISETSHGLRCTRLSGFLNLLLALISDDLSHLEKFVSMKGPKLISMLLQQQSSACLSMETLDSIMSLANFSPGSTLIVTADATATVSGNLVMAVQVRASFFHSF